MSTERALLRAAWNAYRSRRRLRLESRSSRVGDLRMELELYGDLIASIVLDLLDGRRSRFAAEEEPELRAAIVRLRDAAWRPRVAGDAQRLLAQLDHLERLAAIARRLQTADGFSKEETPGPSRTGSVAPPGPPAAAGATEGLTFPETQVRRKYGTETSKHAVTFGVTGRNTAANRRAWVDAMRQLIAAPETRFVRGTYGGEPALLALGRSRPDLIVLRPDGRFRSAWQRSWGQYETIRTSGALERRNVERVP